MNSTILRMTPGLRAAASSPAPAKPAPRSLEERLGATLRRFGEGLSPRALRRALADLQSVADSRISEVEAGRRAAALMQWYAGLDADSRRDVWLLMSERFAPDVKKIQAAREHIHQPLSPELELGVEDVERRDGHEIRIERRWRSRPSDDEASDYGDRQHTEREPPTQPRTAARSPSSRDPRDC